MKALTRNLVGFQWIKFMLQKPYLTSTPSTQTNMDPQILSNCFCTFHFPFSSLFFYSLLSCSFTVLCISLPFHITLYSNFSDLWTISILVTNAGNTKSNRKRRLDRRPCTQISAISASAPPSALPPFPLPPTSFFSCSSLSPSYSNSRMIRRVITAMLF